MEVSNQKGFSLVEALISGLVIMFVGISLAKGILDLTRYKMRLELNRLAIDVAQSWANYINSLSYDSWVISPDPSERPGGGDLYCFDCAFNKAICSSQKKDWSNSGKEYYCSFYDPNYSPLNNGNKPFDADRDGIIAYHDPYYGNNNCKDGSQNCSKQDKKYFFPSWYLAGWIRFQPDWGQGSSDCVCRLGNCDESSRVGSGWTSWDGSYNYRIGSQYLGGLKCTYEVKKGISGAGISWNPNLYKVYVGMVVIKYYDENNLVNELGKAIGIVVWYFDPITLDYKAVYQTVHKEKP